MIQKDKMRILGGIIDEEGLINWARLSQHKTFKKPQI